MKTLILCIGLLTLILSGCKKENKNEDPEPQLPNDLPRLENAVFSNPTVITNPYYGPDGSKSYIYEGGEVGQSPNEKITIERKTATKVINGVTCIIHHDLVKKNDVIIEDTDDWIAQDDAGNLWYFGETVKNYDDNGIFSDNDGSWETGVDEALPGYWMPANPVLGQKYYQEYYADEAEDQAEVIAVGQTITIGMGTYQNCIITKDFTRFETNIYEKKYYAPGVGFIKEEKFENNVLIEVLELKSIIQ